MTVLQDNPLHEISATSFVLGVLTGSSLVVSVVTGFNPLAVYISLLGLFHFLEYFITARYNFFKVSRDSFLLRNGTEYTVAHVAAILEFVIERFVLRWRTNSKLTLLGLSIALIGQTLRSTAMIEAGESFSHVIADTKRENHALVTGGVYRLSRHPSYAGFFWWAMGTQLMLNNTVCFAGFATVLWRFFNRRIRYEESTLVSFFKEDYVNYRKRTRTLIPFV